MITYGEFAEQYFGEASTSTPDDTGLKNKNTIVSALSDQTLIKPEQTEEEASIRYAGCSLILLSDTTLRVYFEPAEGVDLANVGFTSGGAALTKGSYKENGKTYYYADVTGIKPKALSASVTVTATANNQDYVVTLSPMFYVKDMLNRTEDDKLVNLLRALYAYYEQAVSYHQ